MFIDTCLYLLLVIFLASFPVLVSNLPEDLRRVMQLEDRVCGIPAHHDLFHHEHDCLGLALNFVSRLESVDCQVQ